MHTFQIIKIPKGSQLFMVTQNKNNNSGSGRGVAQVVEHLPRKAEALNSNPSITKKKKKNNFIVRLRQKAEFEVSLG
jgi:hypothetical protein